MEHVQYEKNPAHVKSQHELNLDSSKAVMKEGWCVSPGHVLTGVGHGRVKGSRGGEVLQVIEYW